MVLHVENSLRSCFTFSVVDKCREERWTVLKSLNTLP
jgi:hypothetical protein